VFALRKVSQQGAEGRLRIIIAIAIFSQWSGNGLISYYSHLVFDSVGITNPRTQAALNAGLAMWNFTCAMTGAMLIDKLGTCAVAARPRLC
jgi:hypothetical protein